MGAGGSARREYERRRARDRERRRRSWKWSLVGLVVVPASAFVGVLLAVEAVNTYSRTMGDTLAQLPDRSSRSTTTTAIGTTTTTDTGPTTSTPGSTSKSTTGSSRAAKEGKDVLDRGTTLALASALAGIMALQRLALVLRRKQSTEAWRIGAEGEEATDHDLRRLGSRYVVYGDLPMPTGRENVDHLVIGPTGVFTIETKNWGRGIQIGRRRVRSGGRAADHVIDQALRQAAAMGTVLGVDVTPIVCVRRGGIQLAWFASPVVRGVHFVKPGRLKATVGRRRRVSSRAEVDHLVARLEAYLHGDRTEAPV